MKNKIEIFLFIFIILYSIFLGFLAKKTSIEFDETTHSLLAVFYKDLIKYSISHPNFKSIYDYAYSYLVYFPKLSVYYPPLVHLIISFFFYLFPPSFFIARLVIIFFSLSFMLLIFKFSSFILKNKKMALLTVAIFACMPITVYLSRGVYLDLPMAFIFTLSIFFYLKAFEKKKKKYYFLAGLISGIGFLIKWFIVFIYPIIFIYTYLEKRNEIKNVILSFLLAGLIAAPYILIANKLGVFLLVFASKKGTLLPALETVPQANTIEGWLVYFNFINIHYFFFPLSILMLYSLYKYVKNKNAYWKLIILWIGLVYIFLTLIPNKDPRFFYLSVFPFCLVLSKQIVDWKIKENLKLFTVAILLLLNFLAFFNLFGAKSFYGKPTFTFQFYKTYGKEISKFISSKFQPTYFASETPRALPSEVMFHLASKGEFIKILRPCAGNYDINNTLYETGVKWIIFDTEDKNNSYIKKLKKQGLIALEKTIDNIEIYSYNFFNPEPKENCNIVCLTEEKICERIKLPSS